MKPFDDAAMVRLEASLGLSHDGDESARSGAIALDIERRVLAWEGMRPKELLKDREVFDAIFSAFEMASVFAFMNDGYLPKRIDGRLLDRMGPVWTRFIKQVSRETAAERARQSGREERQRGGWERAAKSPKTAAKADAFKLWKERREGKHPTLRTNEQFAMECMRRWPVLESNKTIVGWCTAWNKAAKKSQSAS